MLHLHPRGPVPVVVRPPRLVRAAGITLGLTTLEGFERRYGRAVRYTGGHSGGAGAWYDVRHGVSLGADGFNIARGGEVLDSLSVAWRPMSEVGIKVPHIRLHRGDLGLLSTLRRGMSRRQAESALRARLLRDDLHLTGLIRYVPRPVNKANDRYTQWTLHLDFGPRGLEAFTVGCD